jgi:hypothetical protein
MMVLNLGNNFFMGNSGKTRGIILWRKSRFRDNKNNKFENIPVQFIGDYNFKTNLFKLMVVLLKSLVRVGTQDFFFSFIL